MNNSIIYRMLTVLVLLLSLGVSGYGQAPKTPVVDMYKQAFDYLAIKGRELASQGKRVDAEKREELESEQKDLAKKYAMEIETRSDIKGIDVYYLGSLYKIAGNDTKTLETMKRFIAQYPPDIKGDAIQSARVYVVILSAKLKQFDEAEQTFQTWLKGEPFVASQRPALEQSLAVSLYKGGRYDEAVKHGQTAFDLLKKTEAKTFAERRARMELYGNLVEILALSYRKAKQNDEALNVLAESRALSFTIPSAKLYRKVMSIVDGSGFSEKKLMQKVESYKTAEPAPELSIQEWIGQEATTLEAYRGKVVLLDFWATWCGPCISTFPRLREWHKKFGDKGLKIIGMTQFYGSGDGKKLTELQEIEFLGEFKKKYNLPYSFAVTRRGEDNAKYDVSAYPTTILLDRKGVVRYIGIGAGLEESENLEDMIKEVLKEEN